MWGSRKDKYAFLTTHSLRSIKWNLLNPAAPDYFLVPRDNDLLDEYKNGIALNMLFPMNSVGIVTARDALTIHERKDDLIRTIHDFSALPVEDARKKYNLGKDAQDWTIQNAQKDLQESGLNSINVTKIYYRPFDTRWTYYTGQSKGFHCRPRGEVMQHMLRPDNIALNVSKQQKSSDFQHVFCHRLLSESSLVSNRTSEISYSFPLYRYDNIFDEAEQKAPNLDDKIYAKIKKKIPDVTPENLFDYIYAVLHAPSYRERYAEFLKSDFPRIPYPADSKTFHALAEKGAELRALHLMESPTLDNLITTYPVDGDHAVDKPAYKNGNVYINTDQYFGGVPETAWNFYIGGYQPAQKWLKDRRGRSLSIDDIMHYQRIIVALTETARIMQEINQIKFLPEE